MADKKDKASPSDGMDEAPVPVLPEAGTDRAGYPVVLPPDASIPQEQAPQPTAVPVVMVPQKTVGTVKKYDCPHCGAELTPHNDAIGQHHCYSPGCRDCCFLAPDGSEGGGVREKMEARYCPMRSVRA